MDIRELFISPVKEKYRVFRRLISPGFSDSAMTSQKPIIVDFANKFITSLRRRAQKPIDLYKTYI